MASLDRTFTEASLVWVNFVIYSGCMVRKNLNLLRLICAIMFLPLCPSVHDPKLVIVELAPLPSSAQVLVIKYLVVLIKR